MKTTMLDRMVVRLCRLQKLQRTLEATEKPKSKLDMRDIEQTIKSIQAGFDPPICYLEYEALKNDHSS